MDSKSLRQAVPQVGGNLGPLVGALRKQQGCQPHAQDAGPQHGEQHGGPGGRGACGVKAAALLQKPVAAAQGGGCQQQRQPEQQQCSQIQPRGDQGDYHGEQQHQSREEKGPQAASFPHQKPPQKEQKGEGEQAEKHRALPLHHRGGKGVHRQGGQGYAEFLAVCLQHPVYCVGAALHQILEEKGHHPHPQADQRQRNRPGLVLHQKEEEAGQQAGDAAQRRGDRGHRHLECSKKAA